MKKRRSDLIAERGKLINPLKKEIDHCETRIMELEETVEENNMLLITASQAGDIGEIQSLSKKVSDDNTEIETLFEKLELAQEKFDRLSEKYEDLLEELS